MTRSLEPLRIQRGAEHVHRLGSRAVTELLMEIGTDLDCMPAIIEKMDRYRHLTPAQVRAAGGDRFPPAPLHEVPR